MKLIDKAKQAAMESAVTKALEYLEKDPETNIPKLMELVDKFTPQDWYKGQRDAIRNAIQDTDSNWYKLIMNLYQLDPGVRKVFFQNFIVNASLKGSARQEEVAAQNNCNVPWAILLDPTSACNLKCTGCWAAEYGHKLNLDLETIDSIICLLYTSHLLPGVAGNIVSGESIVFPEPCQVAGKSIWLILDKNIGNTIYRF